MQTQSYLSDSQSNLVVSLPVVRFMIRSNYQGLSCTATPDKPDVTMPAVMQISKHKLVRGGGLFSCRRGGVAICAGILCYLGR